MTVELDQIESQLIGSAVAHPSDLRLPSAFVPVTINVGDISVDQSYPIFPVDPKTGQPVQWSAISGNFPPGTVMSARADTKWRLSPSGTLYIGWETDIGHTGLAVLKQGPLHSTRVSLPISTWDEFKAYALQQPPYRYIFRGQSDSRWPLKTHFHRTGRADLRRFVNTDIPTLHRNLTGLTAHYFDLNDATQYGSFNALVQHHGYPTPLLDWTFSPYVAAYFAYRGLKKADRDSGEKVRILIFDVEEWMKDFLQILQYVGRRHFSVFAPLGINNTRLLPQQSISTICNVDDIEGYLAELENERQKTYLRVIDLPKSECSKVMQELSMMGITSGSLFPGLDGACEQLRERYFDYYRW